MGASRRLLCGASESSWGLLGTSRAHPGAQGVAKKHAENAKRPKEIPKTSAADPTTPQRASQEGARRRSNGVEMIPRDLAEDVGSEKDEKLKNDDPLDRKP